MTLALKPCKRINAEIVANGGKPAEGEPVLPGITKASLETDSFIQRCQTLGSRGGIDFGEASKRLAPGALGVELIFQPVFKKPDFLSKNYIHS